MHDRAIKNAPVDTGFISSNDMTVDLYPGSCSITPLQTIGYSVDKHTPLRIRLVKVMLDMGEIEVLMTNLYDTEVYMGNDLKQVYNLRWEIETYYGYLKQELQLALFSRH